MTEQEINTFCGSLKTLMLRHRAICSLQGSITRYDHYPIYPKGEKVGTSQRVELTVTLAGDLDHYAAQPTATDVRSVIGRDDPVVQKW